MATSATSIEAARELDELYRSHAAEVFRYAYAVLGNRADAEDITQTTFVNALRALERGERPRTPKNWLIAIAHNLIRQRFRQQQSRPRQVELDDAIPAVEAGNDDGPSLDDLVRALQRIPPNQREALVLRELEGRSYVEIAALLGVSQSALETLIFRARRSLAEELENLVTCDAAELALSRATDGRLGRKERRRLRAHLDECATCARTAARSLKYRRAFKTLAVLPIPYSLTLFKGAPSASAAVGLPTIGAAAGSGAAVGVSAKIAVGLAAVAVAGGAGYEGVKAVSDAPPAPRAAKLEKAEQRTPAAAPARLVVRTPAPVGQAVARPAPRKLEPAARPARGKSAAAPGRVKTQRRATPPRGKSALAPGHAQTRKPRTTTRPVQKDKTTGKSAAAPGRTKPAEPARAVPLKPRPKAKQDRAAKPRPQAAAAATKAQKPPRRATPASPGKPAASSKPAALPAAKEKRAKPEKVS